MIKPRRCNEVCNLQTNENFKDLTESGSVIIDDADVRASPNAAVVPKQDGK